MRAATQSTRTHDADSQAVQSPVTSDGLMTVAEASKFLRLGRNSIYNAMAAGQLPYCMFGRRRCIPRLALVAFAEAHLTGGWAIQPHTIRGDESQATAGLRVAKPCCQGVAKFGEDGAR